MPPPSREASSKGGRTTADRHGPAHMATIGREGGKKGIRTYAARYFGGNVAEAMRRLRERAVELRIARGVDEKQERELAAGARIACQELPVICDPDDDPTFIEEPKTWRRRILNEKAARMIDDLEIPF